MERARNLAAGAFLFSLLISRSGADPLVPASGFESAEDAVVLEESLDIEILSEAEARVSYLNRTQVLTPHGAERYGVASVSYNPWVTIRNLRASVVSPAGKRMEVKKQGISDGSDFASYELYSDWKQRRVHFPGGVPGSVLEYRYETMLHTLFFLPRVFPLRDEIPVRLKILTVRVPPSFPLRPAVQGGSPVYTREERDGVVIHRWTLRDAPALKREPNGPPEEDLVPRVSLYPRSIVWGEHRIDAGTWSGIALWYRDLARDRMVPGATVAETARNLTAGLRTPEEKTRHLYEFVQGKVNYVAIELGIGGFQPHQSDEVLSHRYGDCKDKATLLIAMLHSVGLEGLSVLLRTRDSGLLDRDYPSTDFNHVIVAIPGPDGYLFLDPTSEWAPYGDLPWNDQGVSALVIREDGQGDLVVTPLFPPERNRRHRLVTARVESSGDLAGSYIIDVWGDRRSAMTSFLATAKPTAREEVLADLMARLCPGALISGQELTPPTDFGDPLRTAIRFKVAHFVMRAGGVEIFSPQLARSPDLTEIAAYENRQQAIFFPYLFSDTSEVRVQLPPGRTLKKVPADRRIEGPGLLATTNYEMVREEDRDVLVVRRSVSVSRREIPVADYPALRNFLAALAQEDAGAVTLVPDG